MAKPNRVSGADRLRAARRVFRFFFIGLVVLAGVAVILAQVPPSQPDRWSEAGSEFVVRLPRSEVWQRLQNLRLAHNYVPGVEGVEMLTPLERGVGASRRILQEGGGTLDETVVEWEEGSGFVIRLHRGPAGPPAPFEEARFRYWIEGSEAGGTRLSLTILYRPSGGRLGEWIDSAVLNAEMEAQIDALAASMRAYYESDGGVR